MAIITSLRPFLLAVLVFAPGSSAAGVARLFGRGSDPEPLTASQRPRSRGPRTASRGLGGSLSDGSWGSDGSDVARPGHAPHFRDDPRAPGAPAARQRPEENSLYATLLTVQQQFGVDLHVPQLVLLGAQSAGKTTFIQSIIGWKVGFTGNGTATRCPVVYELKNSRRGAGEDRRDSESPSPAAEIKVSVGPSADRLRVLGGGAAELPSVMQDHMKALDDTNRFSDQPLWVRIEQSLPGTKDIILYDLPGLIANPSDQRALENQLFVRRLAALWLRRPENVPVVICAMKGSIEEIGERRELHELATGSQWGSTASPPRPDWASTAIFVVNRINHYLENEFSNAVQVRDFFRQVQNHERVTGTKYHFVALKQDRGETDEKDWDFEQSRGYYKNLVAGERAYLDRTINSMVGGAQFPADFFATLLGLEAAQAAVHDRIERELAKSLPKVKVALLTGRAALEAELRNVDVELNMKNRKVAKGLIACFLQHFHTHFQHLVSAQQMILKKNMMLVGADPNGSTQPPTGSSTLPNSSRGETSSCPAARGPAEYFGGTNPFLQRAGVDKVAVPLGVCELPKRPYEFDDAVAHFRYKPDDPVPGVASENAPTIGLAFEEEFRMVPYSQGVEEASGLIKMAELRGQDHLGAEHSELGKTLAKRFMGSASFNRMLDTVDYLLTVRDSQHIWTDEVIANAASTPSCHRAFHQNDIILSIASGKLDGILPVVEWMNQFLLTHFRRYAQIVFDQLLSGAHYSGFSPGVRAMLQNRFLYKFGLLLERKLVSAMDYFTDYLTSLQRYVPVDLPKRFLMLNLIYPLDDMMSSVDDHVWRGAKTIMINLEKWNEETLALAKNPFLKEKAKDIANFVRELRLSTEEDKAFTSVNQKLSDRFDPTVAKELAQIEILWKKAPEANTLNGALESLKKVVEQNKPAATGHYVNDSLAPNGPPQRSVQVLETLRTVVKVLAETMQNTFNAEDLVAPGGIQPRQQDPGMVNYEYIRSSAERYYMVMLTLAIDQMKRTWTEKFLFYLSKEHSDELSHDLRMLQHEILYMGEAEWQQEVWLYENPGSKSERELREDIENIENQLAGIKTALQQLEAGDHRTGGSSLTSRGRLNLAAVMTSNTGPSVAATGMPLPLVGLVFGGESVQGPADAQGAQGNGNTPLQPATGESATGAGESASASVPNAAAADDPADPYLFTGGDRAQV